MAENAYQDIDTELAEIRRKQQEELAGMKDTGFDWGMLLGGGLGALADQQSASGGGSSTYAKSAVEASQASNKNARDLRLKALESYDTQIKALNELAKNRAADRKQENVFNQQWKLLGESEKGKDRRAQMGVDSLSAKEAAKANLNPAKRDFDLLPPESQEQIKDIAKKTANKVSISNQIDSTVTILDDPKISGDQKLMQARQLIKTLNSTQGQDAVGAEEAKRLAGLLDFNLFNLTNPGPVVGRAPISDFADQAKLTSAGLRNAAALDQNEVNRLYGRESTPVTLPDYSKMVGKKSAPGGLIPEATAGAGAPDPVVDAYSKQNGIDYQKAEAVLKGRGYVRK